MKFSINAWGFDPAMSLTERSKVAKNAGFDAIELNLEEGDCLLYRGIKDADLELMKKQASDEGVEISSICSELHWKYSLISNDIAERTEAEQLGAELIRCASVLGVNVVLMIPGIITAPNLLRKNREVIPSDTAWQRSLESMRKLGDMAKIYGIHIGLENVGFNRFLVSPIEMKQFINELGHEYVHVYLDIGNANVFGVAEDWIRILSSSICSIHLKDSMSNDCSLNTFRPAFLGDVNWHNVGVALKEITYNGYLVVEQSFTPYCWKELIYFLGSSLIYFKRNDNQ